MARYKKAKDAERKLEKTVDGWVLKIDHKYAKKLAAYGFTWVVLFVGVVVFIRVVS